MIFNISNAEVSRAVGVGLTDQLCARNMTLTNQNPNGTTTTKTRNYHNTNKNKSQPHHKMAENIKTNAKQIIKLKIRQSPTTIHRRALIKQMITDYFFTKNPPQTMPIQYRAAICISNESKVKTVKTKFMSHNIYQTQKR